jgi:hypothetical protein
LEEEEFYPVVAEWLSMQGYEPLITGGKKRLSIPIVPLLPGRLFLEPDVVGLKNDSTLAAIEVKTDPRNVIEGLGQCLVYTLAADKVYLALTEDICQEIRSLKLFESCRLGLLSLRQTREKVVSVIEDTGKMKVTPAPDAGDVKLATGWWAAEEKIPPGTNYNVDYGGLHAELLRQTKLNLGKA